MNASVSANIRTIFCFPRQVKATAQPDTVSKTAEPDSAEIWKKDFQCQWYKTADGEVSDQQSPKDGALFGGKANTEDMVETTIKSATETVLIGSDLPATESPTASLNLPTNCANPLYALNLYILLLGAVSLRLGP